MNKLLVVLEWPRVIMHPVSLPHITPKLPNATFRVRVRSCIYVSFLAVTSEGPEKLGSADLPSNPHYKIIYIKVSVLRIRVVYPGSDFFLSRMPDPHQKI